MYDNFSENSSQTDQQEELDKFLESNLNQTKVR